MYVSNIADAHAYNIPDVPTNYFKTEYRAYRSIFIRTKLI